MSIHYSIVIRFLLLALSSVGAMRKQQNLYPIYKPKAGRIITQLLIIPVKMICK